MSDEQSEEQESADQADGSDGNHDSTQQDSGDGGDGQELSKSEKSQTIQDPPPTWLEWGVRITSLAVLAALVGFVVINGLSSDQPSLLTGQVTHDDIDQRNGTWVVPATITNAGDESLVNVSADLVLSDGDDDEIESASVTISLLGAGASEDVEFRFERDPRDLQLEFDFGGSIVP